MSTAAASPGYLTLRDASLYVGLSEKTIRRLESHGRVKAHRVGNRLLFAREALDRMVRGEPTEAPKP